jgi:TonB family protein
MTEPAPPITPRPPLERGTGSASDRTGANSDPGNLSTAPPAHAACGNGTVEPGEQCDDGNIRNGDGCSSTCAKEVIARSPVTIEPRALHDQQLSGDTNVPASKLTRDSMIRNRVSSLKAVIKLCVDTTGLVTDSTLTERTGYTEYDSKLLEAINEWHYRPYLINGTPVTVCSTVEFIYSPQ